MPVDLGGALPSARKEASVRQCPDPVPGRLAGRSPSEEGRSRGHGRTPSGSWTSSPRHSRGGARIIVRRCSTGCPPRAGTATVCHRLFVTLTPRRALPAVGGATRRCRNTTRMSSVRQTRAAATPGTGGAHAAGTAICVCLNKGQATTLQPIGQMPPPHALHRGPDDRPSYVRTGDRQSFWVVGRWEPQAARSDLRTLESRS